MGFAKKDDYSITDYKEKYQDITALYDRSDELLATIEDTSLGNPEERLNILEPLINEIADSTDILAEEFILVAESKKPRASAKFSKKRIENALRRVFSAMQDYQEKSRISLSKFGMHALSATDKIIEKIQQQLDKVVAVFLELINITLQSIIGKTEIDALRARNARVALMMHQINLSQHGI